MNMDVNWSRVLLFSFLGSLLVVTGVVAWIF